MATFSDYFNQQASVRPPRPQRTPAAPTYDLSWLPKPGQSVEEPEPQSPLNWALDILSRGLYGSTTAFGGVLDAIDKSDSVEELVPNSIGAIAAIPTNFLAGVFDTAGGEGTKRTTSDFIEQTTDVLGRKTDPRNYVDRENNVDPVIKGVAGFAGDVVADPLTWIPGGLILKGAKGLGTLAKTGVEAAETAVKTVRGAEKVADVATPAARVVDDVAEQVPTVKPVVDEGNPFGAEARAPRDLPSVEPVPKVDYVLWAKTVKTPEVQKALQAHEKLLAKGEGVTASQLAKSEAKLSELYTAATKTPSVGAEVGDRTLAQVLGDAPKTPIIRQELQAVLDSVGAKTTTAPKLNKAWLVENRNTKVNDVPADLGAPPAQFVTLFRDIGDAAAIRGTKPITLERAARIMSDPTVGEASRTYARKLIEHQHRLSVGAASSDVADALVAFNMRKQADIAKMEDILGAPLFHELSRKNTAKSMDVTIRKVLDALDPEADLAKFYSTNPRLGDALNDSLGIPRYVKPAANTVEETAATVKQIAEDPTVSGVLAKTLRRELPISKKFGEEWPDRKGLIAFTKTLDKELRSGNRFLELNTMTQQTLSKNLWKAIEQEAEKISGKSMDLKNGGIRGKERNVAVEAAYLGVGGKLVESLQSLGVKLHIGIGEDLLPITFPEVYELVGKAIPSETARLFALYNGGTRVAITPLLQAVHRAVMAGDTVADDVLRQEVREIVSGKLKWGKKGEAGEALPNNIASNAAVSKFKGWTSEKLVNALADGIVAARGTLAARISDNAEAWAARGLDESSKLGQKELDALKAVIGDDVFDESAEAIARLGKDIADEGAATGAVPSSVVAATEMVKKGVGDLTVKIADTAVKTKRAVEQGVSRTSAVSKGSQKKMDDIVDEQESLLDQGMPDVDALGAVKVGVDENVPALDLASMKPDPVVAQQGFVGGVLNGFRGTFDQSYGMDRLWNVAHSKRTISGQYLGTVIGHLRELRKFPDDVQVAALKAVQSGVPNANADIASAVKLVEDVVGPIFGRSGDTLLNNKFLSVESDISHINAILRQKGLSDDFRLSEELSDWRDWDITSDVSRNLLKLADAAATVAEHRSIVSSFVTTMKKEGLASTTPKPGMVRVADSGGSTFARLIPDGTYVDREMATQLHRLDVLTRTSRQFSGEVGKFINEYYMPVQSIWKQLITVFRPGHHLRNLAGNNFMSWIDRGNRHYLSSQRDAMRILALKNNYKDIDLVQALKDFGDDAVPTGGQTVVSGRFSMTDREIADIAEKNGLFSTYASSEDLLLDATQGRISRVGDAISNSKIGSLAGNVSHAIDHHAKLQHLVQILKQEAGSGRYARYGRSLSKAKVIERAIRDVKRSHPDALMLTPTESKFRFLIPFYTWFAKTLPFAMESAARNPGRVVAIPKASYNLAVANGVNPDTLSDPFPEDQMFPSYITEGIFGPQFQGPDGEYININPGVPQFDLLKDIGTDPIRGAAGMISPLIRMPAEMLSGGQWATGAPIKDTSDYLDQNLPIVNYIANLTGQSVTGSVPSVLSGQGLDPQAQVAAGNKGDLDRLLTFMNWFTGANAQNWSRPNVVNYAEIEKRNRESGKSGGF